MKELSKMNGVGICLVNNVMRQIHDMDPTLDNQIVRASEIGLYQTH